MSSRAGSSVVANSWAIHKQADLYPDVSLHPHIFDTRILRSNMHPQPLTFKPERFIAEDGTFQGVPGAEQRGHFGFGFGRRFVSPVVPPTFIRSAAEYVSAGM